MKKLKSYEFLMVERSPDNPDDAPIEKCFYTFYEHGFRLSKKRTLEYWANFARESGREGVRALEKDCKVRYFLPNPDKPGGVEEVNAENIDTGQG